MGANFTFGTVAWVKETEWTKRKYVFFGTLVGIVVFSFLRVLYHMYNIMKVSTLDSELEQSLEDLHVNGLSCDELKAKVEREEVDFRTKP